MPILWFYALQNYLRVFSFSILTFISVLIVARFKEIARFTALSGSFTKTGLYIFYHIPTILPIAIPISSLIASLLFFQSLSNSRELTALRSCGLSLFKIISPLLLASFLISIFNFCISSEIAPYCRREGKTLLYQETSTNPLLLLQRQKLVKIKYAFLDMDVQDDQTTKNLTLIVPNETTQRLSLFSAKKLWLEQEELMGKDLAIISYIEEGENFDTLIIENQSEMSTAAPLLSMALKKNRPRLDINAIPFKMLFFAKDTKKARIEMLRRISLSLAVFSFTFLGCAFGIDQARVASRKNLLIAIFLSLTVLLSYLLGKELKNLPFFAFLAYLLPHPFIWICSSIQLRRLSRGRL